VDTAVVFYQRNFDNPEVLKHFWAEESRIQLTHFALASQQSRPLPNWSGPPADLDALSDRDDRVDKAPHQCNEADNQRHQTFLLIG
jgi:hypothetical protein